MKLAGPRGPARWLARGLVLALHAAALLVLLAPRAPAPQRPAGERSPMLLRLLPLKPHDPPTPQQPPPKPVIATAPAVRLQAPAPRDKDDSAQKPQASTPPARAEPAATPAPPAGLSAEPPRARLNLALPPGYAASAAARNPALSDARANTPRPTLEDRIANATGGAGAWVEERVENRSQSVGAQGEYRTVLRRGSTCVEVFRSRISDNNAFNSSVAPSTVAVIGQPYPCK